MLTQVERRQWTAEYIAVLQELGVVEQVAQQMQYADVCWRMLTHAGVC